MDNELQKLITTQQYQWKTTELHGAFEMVPVNDTREHYAGDECWCKPLVRHQQCANCHETIPIFIHRHSIFVSTNPQAPQLTVGQYEQSTMALCGMADDQVKRGHHG